MLDIQAYRQAESRARAVLPNWRLAQRHNLDHFEKVGFPVRLNSLAETYNLLDTMQEERFQAMQNELGGLTPEDFDLVVDACVSVLRFQAAHYPGRPLFLPLDTLLSMLSIYKKITTLNPDFTSMLEVGPGCGYLPCLFALRGKPMEYASIEACESFYLLQHYLNLHLFGQGFRQEVFADLPASHHFADPSDWAIRERPVLDKSPFKVTARQYPWWRLGELAEQGPQFDVITSNANFTEFNTEAFQDYLRIFRKVLKPDGFIYAQCFGYPTPERDFAYVYDNAMRVGFAPAFLAPHCTGKRKNLWEQGTPPELQRYLREGDKRTFMLSNLVLIGKGHPLFEQCKGRDKFDQLRVISEDIARAFFGDPEVEVRMYTKQAVIDAVTAKLAQA